MRQPWPESQRRKVDRVIYHPDTDQIGTNREGFYVAVSRARDEVKMFTDNTITLRDAVRESRGQN